MDILSSPGRPTSAPILQEAYSGKRKLARRSVPAKPLRACGEHGGGDACSAGLGPGYRGREPEPILLAPLFAVAAQGGDLFESKMKRTAGIKDLPEPGCPAMAAFSIASMGWFRLQF